MNPTDPGARVRAAVKISKAIMSVARKICSICGADLPNTLGHFPRATFGALGVYATADACKSCRPRGGRCAQAEKAFAAFEATGRVDNPLGETLKQRLERERLEKLRT